MQSVSEIEKRGSVKVYQCEKKRKKEVRPLPLFWVRQKNNSLQNCLTLFLSLSLPNSELRLNIVQSDPIQRTKHNIKVLKD